MNSALLPASTTANIWRPLLEDRALLVLLAGLCVAAIPLVVPVFSGSWLEFYGQRMVTPPFLLAALTALCMRLSATKQPGERWFWALLVFAFAWWLIAGLTGALRAQISNSTHAAIVANVPYLVFYATFAWALEIRPRARRSQAATRMELLDRAGSLVLVAGTALYFLVVPNIASNDAHGFWSSSWAMFVALDCYLLLRLWHLQRKVTTARWRRIYVRLFAAVALWGTGDVLWALMHVGAIADPGYGSPLALLWPAAFVFVFMASRAPVISRRAQSAAVMPDRPGAGLLVPYALLPLATHVLLYRLMLANPQSEGLRELLALVITAALAAMALGYQKLLRIENQRLTDEEARARDELTYLAYHDELTGLSNRNMFRDRLQRAVAEGIRNESRFAVLFCDLDQFKVINDSLGHEAGDVVLNTAASRLLTTLRGVDTVARLGGDEFAVIAQRMKTPLDAAQVAEKLLTALRLPMSIGSKSHVVTASIGVAVFPDDGTDEDTLLKHADTAMYQAKLHGRDTYRLFTEAMNEAANERLAIEQALRNGIMEDQFAMFYQPIVDVESGQVRSCEALLRWNHPERGYVSPVNFIDVAEQTGLIVPIGRWTLEQACAWAARQNSDCSVAVNISPRQVREPSIIQDVQRILAQTRLAPERLHLEITESMALDVDSTADTLRGLRDIGIKVAIDDFGTGYAALNLLQDFPVDIVKIDRSFVKGIEADSVNAAIVHAVVNMAKALDFYVVAEGVETATELATIRQTRCDAVQGYLLCKPMLEQDLASKLSGAWNWLPQTSVDTSVANL